MDSVLVFIKNMKNGDVENINIKNSVDSITETEILKRKEENEQVLEELSIEERFSYLLNNEESIAQINTFPEEYRSKIIGILVEYLILFPNKTVIKDYLDNIKKICPLLKEQNGINFKKEKIKLLIESVAESLSIKELDSFEAKEKIFQYFLEQFIKNGYYFHSFNGSFEESIRENGIDTDIRQWDWKELDRIREICTRVGVPRIFGWADLNCEGKISVSDEIQNLYIYGVASPEWFAQFISEGFHIPSEGPYNKKAFYERDYNSAKRNILMLSEKLSTKSEEDIQAGKAYPNLTLDERMEILKFFEKYWGVFATEKSSPKCALIKRSSIFTNERILNSYKEFNEQFNDFSLERCIDMLISSRRNDVQLQEKISPEDISIINLPEYSRIYTK